VTDETFELMIDVNIRANVKITRAVLANMPEGGSIVTISSQMGHIGSPNRTIYCLCKHALEGFTKALAIELAPRNIRVNAVAPTFIETPMTKPMLEDEKFKQFVENMIPLGKIGHVNDVAAAVLYLSSTAANMVTGHSLLIDGGWTAQ
ncbi:MAG: SDR family oxidoreductase, partial [Alphaproteobacteria bacterium]|nr:SDR family oxidoreductase [Alphaproteobacteria bacterium]